jgi:hypothetical protein
MGDCCCEAIPDSPPALHAEAPLPGWIKLYADIGLAMLRLFTCAVGDSCATCCATGKGCTGRRDKQRIWLYSAARVAQALGVTGLSGRPVALPAAALLGGIGAFRAHLYAAFHSSRAKEAPDGEQTMPIARQTLAGLSGWGGPASGLTSSERASGCRLTLPWATW